MRDEFVNTAAPPASTTVAISQLARPGALFEVEAIAVLPAKAAAKLPPRAANAGKRQGQGAATEMKVSSASTGSSTAHDHSM